MSCGSGGPTCRRPTPRRVRQWSPRWTRSTRARPGWRTSTRLPIRWWWTSGPRGPSCWPSGVLPMARSKGGDFRYDARVPLKTRLDGVRVLPGAIARWGSYVAPGTVLMPSFVNIGAYVDEGTMVDTWATVGSAAQIGKNVHLSGGAGIGGVLEPPSAVPVVVEDEAFVGSRSVGVGGGRGRGGAKGRAGAKLAAGTILTATTHVIDV